MTTEDDFQQLLDANPEDHHTRLVFADWLQERGDPRAEGYRALGRTRTRPYRGNWFDGAVAKWFRRRELGEQSDLWKDWFEQLEGYLEFSSIGRRDYGSRREAEDAAATAFAKLPAERRAELLAPTVSA